MVQLAAGDKQELGLYIDVPAGELEASSSIDRLAPQLSSPRVPSRDSPSFVGKGTAKAWASLQRKEPGRAVSYGYQAGRELTTQIPAVGPFIKALMPQSVPAGEYAGDAAPGAERVAQRPRPATPTFRAVATRGFSLPNDASLAGTTFLIGAGASRAWPAGLPLFDSIRERLIERLRVQPRLHEAAERLAPEAFMKVVYDGGLPLDDWLTALLSQGEPNAVHYSLAAAIERGATVWTVNVDDNIERACEALGIPIIVAADPNVPPNGEARLLKPHGSVRDRHYIFRSDQVVRPLPSEWSERLTQDTFARELVVFGYRGADVDLRFHVGRALPQAASVRWFAPRVEWKQLTAQFDGLHGRHCTPVVTDEPADLTRKFLEWADGLALTRHVTPALRGMASDPRQQDVPHLPGRTRTARGLLYAGIGARHEAKVSLALAAMTFEPRSKLAVRTLVMLSAYTRSWWTRLVLWLTARGPVATRLPTRARHRLDRVHVTILSSYVGDFEATIRRVESAVDQHDLAIRLATAKAQRTLGQLDKAEQTARSCLEDATHERQVDETAHASFELAFTLTWKGQLSDAKAVLADLFNGRDAQASVRWIGWARFQQGSVSIYENDPESARRHFDEGVWCFQADGLDSGIVGCTLGKMTACRLSGDGDAFRQCQQTVASYQPKGWWRRTEGWTDFTTNSLLLELAEFERCHEASHDRSRFEAVLASQTVRPLHEALALLGLAELDVAEGRDANHAARCRDVASRAGLRYVQAHLAITLFRGGRLTNDEALQQLRDSNAELSLRAGGDADDAEAYCLGAHAEHHELFLP